MGVERRRWFFRCCSGSGLLPFCETVPAFGSVIRFLQQYSRFSVRTPALVPGFPASRPPALASPRFSSVCAFRFAVRYPGWFYSVSPVPPGAFARQLRDAVLRLSGSEPEFGPVRFLIHWDLLGSISGTIRLSSRNDRGLQPFCQ